MYAKKQWCEYEDKVAGSWTRAQVMGVHMDDGPEKPYYTVSFGRVTDGVEERIEKQTQPERLRRLVPSKAEEVSPATENKQPESSKEEGEEEAAKQP